MKYMICVTNPPIENGHFTFAYFGRQLTKREMMCFEIIYHFFLLESFTLKYVREDYFDKDDGTKVRVSVYEPSSGDAAIMRSIFLELLPEDVRLLNRENWVPHITKPIDDQDKEFAKEYRVCGIGNKDCSYWYDFDFVLPGTFCNVDFNFKDTEIYKTIAKKRRDELIINGNFRMLCNITLAVVGDRLRDNQLDSSGLLIPWEISEPFIAGASVCPPSFELEFEDELSTEYGEEGGGVMIAARGGGGGRTEVNGNEDTS